MKRAMYHQVFNLATEAQAQFARPSVGGLYRNHDVSNVTRLIVGRRPFPFMISEREHVCRPVNPAIIAVKAAHRAVAYERDGQDGVRAADAIEHGPRQCGGPISVNLAQSLAVDDLYPARG